MSLSVLSSSMLSTHAVDDRMALSTSNMMPNVPTMPLIVSAGRPTIAPTDGTRRPVAPGRRSRCMLFTHTPCGALVARHRSSA